MTSRADIAPKSISLVPRPASRVILKVLAPMAEYSGTWTQQASAMPALSVKELITPPLLTFRSSHHPQMRGSWLRSSVTSSLRSVSPAVKVMNPLEPMKQSL